MIRPLAFLVPACLAFALTAAPAMAAVSIQDQYWRVDVNEKGKFEIGTTGGDPNTSADDNKSLTSGFVPNGWSTFGRNRTYVEMTSGNMDDLDTWYPIDGPTIQDAPGFGHAIRMDYKNVWGFDITRYIFLGAPNHETGRNDAIEIRFVITNTDTEDRWASLLLFLDLQVGSKDGLPILAPGADVFNESDMVTRETAFGTLSTGLPALPARWLAFESSAYDDEGLRVCGAYYDQTDPTLYPLPDIFAVVNASTFLNEGSDFMYYAQLPRNVSTITDTGVLIQWSQKYLSPGGMMAMSHVIGLQGGNAPAFVDAPKSTDLTAWEFVLWIINMLGEGWDGGTTTLSLSSGLNVKSGPTQAREAKGAGTYALGTVPAGGAQSLVLEIEAASSAPKTYYYGAQTSFSNAPSLLAVGAVNIGTPDSSVENYMHLGVSPTAFGSGGHTTLSWSADSAGWGYAGVPVDVYVAMTMNPAVSDRASTVGEAMGGGGQMYLFYPGMNGIYPYTGRVAGPTFSNVAFPAGAAGSMGMTVSGGSTLYNFAAAFIRRDNGQFIRTDLPVENSAPFYLQ